MKEKVIEGMDDIKMEIKKLSNLMDGVFTGEMKKLSSVVKDSMTFAQAVKQGTTTNTVSRVSSANGVIVIPKEPNVNNVDIERVIKEKVDLCRINIGVTRLKHLKGSGIFLGTKTKEDSGKLEAEAKAKLGDSFKVFLPKPIIPELIITNLEKMYSNEQLMEEIRATNFGFNDEDKLKIVHRRKERVSQKWSYIIQASPNTYPKLVDRYICIDYNDHFIKEHINVLRCFNCQQYHHKASNCTEDPVCSRCAKDHKTSECVKMVSFTCVNCVEANKKGAKLDTRHSCGSKKCQMHLSQIEIKQMKISYNAIPSW